MKKFLSVWSNQENPQQLDWDDFSEDELDENYNMLLCDNYRWETFEDFRNNAKPGDFIFFLGEDGEDGLISRTK